MHLQRYEMSQRVVKMSRLIMFVLVIVMMRVIMATCDIIQIIIIIDHGYCYRHSPNTCMTIMTENPARMATS